jgi:hypothetical protein
MTLVTPTVPNETDYTTWIYNVMGVPTAVLPSDSSYIDYTFQYSLEWVNLYLDIASPLIYTNAVYNFGGNMLVNIAQDDPNAQPPLTPPNDTYWADLRTSLNINSFVPGLINATNDEDTSAALVVPLNLQNLTLADLQMLKTPWGRAYLAIAQSVGSMWGLTM